MKHAFFTGLICSLIGYGASLLFPTHPLEQVIVDGSEMPGLTDRQHPDTCIAYLDSNNRVHLQYANLAAMRVADSLLQADIKSGKAIPVQ